MTTTPPPVDSLTDRARAAYDQNQQAIEEFDVQAHIQHVEHVEHVTRRVIGTILYDLPPDDPLPEWFAELDVQAEPPFDTDNPGPGRVEVEGIQFLVDPQMRALYALYSCRDCGNDQRRVQVDDLVDLGQLLEHLDDPARIPPPAGQCPICEERKANDEQATPELPDDELLRRAVLYADAAHDAETRDEATQAAQVSLAHSVLYVARSRPPAP